MVEIVISFAAKVAEYLVDPIIRPLGYLLNYRRNITDFNQQVEMLNHANVRLQRSVEEANRQGDEILPDVQEWLKGAQGIIQKKEDFIEDEKKANKSCFYLKSRYQLSKQAKKQAGDIVVKIQQAGTFHRRVSYPPPPPLPFISSASFIDSEAFQSRESTFNQIMEALRNEDMSMIGIWGMGGVGKTTLVKHVALQAEEDKLFHKVVMALNISHTPNIAEIQEKMATMLGLKFEVEEDRAGRLRQRLKREEKILVILDDIWEKLELGKIGIPYGDDHKGCKVLLTSRERQVLSKGMRTQNEFHLQHLSDEEAWNLFKKTAGDSVEKLELRPIAVDVAKKCEGLPVAIVTIANALRDERMDVWKNALEELRRSAPTNIRGVSKNVYSCLELSYNHLEGDEVRSLFLLCALLGDGDISMDRLLQHAMGLNLFKEIYSWENATNKLIALVEILKASSLLLDSHEDEDDEKSLFFYESTVLRMHDVVRDVARSIASKDPHQFVVKEDVGLQEEWQWMDECRNCTRISLKCRNTDELPQGLVCPELEFFLLDSSNDDDSYLKIPDAFLQDTKQLRVLDLYKVSLAPSSSSLGFLSNLRTLCLNRCVLQDIAVIGDLKRLQVLSLAESHIEQLPKEMMQLSDLRVLDLWNCKCLEVIPRNVISSLSRLEYLRIEGCSNFEWEKEGFDSGERINACVSELKHLSGLRTLEVRVSDPSLLPEDDLLFDLNLTRYSILIGDPIWMPNDEYKASRRLMLNGVKRLHIVNCSKLLKRSQVLHLRRLNDTKDVVYELDKEGLVELKFLDIEECPTIQYILHSKTSVAWAPNTFRMLEQLFLRELSSLEAVCHGPIPMRSFGNLRILELQRCGRLKYVFSLLTQNRRESDFPQLQSLKLEDLPQVISFYSIRSSDNKELVTFFNQQAAFPSLEFLQVECLDNLRALWHNQLLADSFSKLKELEISCCNKLLNIFSSNILKALQSLQILTIWECPSIQYILRSTSVEWVPRLNTFHMLEQLFLRELSNLEAVCHGSIPMRSFGNLRILELQRCGRLKYVFSLPTLNRGELAFPQLQSLKLEDLPEVISFYSTRSSDSEESVTFFNQQVAFPSLEDLDIFNLNNVEKIWHNHEFIADSFGKLKRLSVRSCKKLRNVIPSNMLKRLPSLQILKIVDCNSLEEVFDLEAIHNKESHDIPAFQLRELCLDNLKNLKCVWNKTPQGLLTYPNLHHVQVSHCPSLKIPFPGYVVRSLLQVKEVDMNSRGVKEIVAHEDITKIVSMSLFPEVTSLTNSCLKELKCFYLALHTLEWPILSKTLEVESCGNLEMLASKLDKPVEQPIFLCDKVAFPNLDYLNLSLKLKEIQHLQILFGAFSNLRILIIENCPFLSSVLSSNFVQSLSNLKKLTVIKCDLLEEVFDLNGLGHADNEHVEMLSKLEELSLIDLPMLKYICNNSPPQVSCFQNLKLVRVKQCGSLMYLFSASMALGVVQLQELYIEHCSTMKEIVMEDSDTDFRPRQLSCFQNLKFIQVKQCDSLMYLISASTASGLVHLKQLCIENCSMIEEIVTAENGVTDKITFPQITQLSLLSLPNLTSFYLGIQNLEVLFNEEVAFPNLEFLYVSGLDNVKKIWHNQLLADSFSKLKETKVENCNELLNIAKSNVLNWLPSLEFLGIASCRKLTEVFDLKETNVQEDETYNRLSRLALDDLQKLEQICNKALGKKLCLQNLKFLEVRNCGSVKKLFSLHTEPEGLKEIIGQEEGAEEVIDKIEFPELTSLSLKSLPSLASFYPGSHTLRRLGSGDHDIFTPVLFSEKVSFPNLEILKLSGLSQLMKIWDRQLLPHSFCNLHILEVEKCPFLLNVVSNNLIARLKNLEKLNVEKCDQLKEVFDLEGLDHADYEHARMLPKLEELKLIDLPQLGHIRNKDLQQISCFENLKLLHVKQCDSLTHLFSSGMALGLKRLKDLCVEHCSMIKEIIMVEDRAAKNIIFPQTTQLALLSLPNLTSFYMETRTHEKVHMGDCDILLLFREKVSFPNLKILKLSGLSKLTGIWDCQLPLSSFCNLHILEVEKCPFLLNVVPNNLIASLKNLEKLNVGKCDQLKEVFDLEGLDHADYEQARILPKLEELKLIDLPQLGHICNMEIQKISFFQNLRVLQLKQCDSLKYLLSASMALGLVQLNDLWVEHCSKIKEIIKEDDGVTEKIIFPRTTQLSLLSLPKLTSFYLRTQTGGMLFSEEVAFPHLADLDISNLDSVEKIWHNEFAADSFGKLKRLSVRSCQKLRNVIPSNMLKRLPSLQILKIVDSNSLEEIFDLKSIDSKESRDIPTLQLRELSLDNLEKLKYVWNNNPQGLLTHQNLKSVQVSHCPSLEIPFPGYVVKSLLQVKEVDINSCGVEEIVAHEGVAKVVAMFLFPKVTSLTKSCLKQLECFYLGLHNLEWPMLKTLEVESYESLEKLASKLDKQVEQPIFLCEKVTFPNLEILNLSLKLKEIQDLHLLFGALSNLKILIVENCPFLLSLFSLQFIQCLNNLKKLTVKKCDLLEEVFDLNGLDHGEMLSQLEEVSLIDLPKLRYICNSPPQVLCFQNLKSLQVKQCNSMTYLFSPSMVLSLVQLQDLRIEHCPTMKEIFALECRDTDNWPRRVSCFQNLKSLQVKQCDSLMYLFPYSVALGLEQLQDLCIEHCSKMNKIIMEDGDVDNRPQQVSSLQKLKFVRVKQCDSLMYLFPPSMALGLVQLQDLCIEDCPMMKEIVAAEDRDFGNQHGQVSCFQNLKSIQVKQCDSLMYLFSSSFALALAQLQDLCIEHCYTMKEIVREYRDMGNRHPQVSCFGNLKFVQVKQCDSLMCLFSSSFALALVQLQDLCIEHCDSMEEIVTAEEGVTDEIIFPQITHVSLLKLPKLTSFYLSQTLEKTHMGDSNTAPGVLFNEEVAFPNLEFLYVSGLDNIKKIWHNQLLADSFSKLKKMKVKFCNELQNISTSNVLNWLPSLEFLKIDSCGKLREVFDQEVINVQEDVTDTELSQLVLDDLQQRLHICNKVLGKYLCLQKLKVLKVHNCGSLKNIFSPYMALGLVPLEGMKEIIMQEGAEDVIDKIEFPELTSLSLQSLPGLASFYPGSHTLRRVGPGDLDILIAVLFNEKVAFPSLVSLHISGLDNVKEIWNNKRTANSFSRLEEVKVEDCNELQNGLPLFVLKWLSSLQFLRLAKCGKLKEVFDLEGAGDFLEDVTATKLNHLVLQDLPQLQHIWNKDPYGILTFQNLDLVEVLSFYDLKSHFPAGSLVRDLSQLEKQLIRSRRPEDFGNNEGKDFVFPKVIIRSRWTEDLGEKGEGEDVVFPEVTYDKLVDVRKMKGKEVLKVHDYVSEISEDIPGSSG